MIIFKSRKLLIKLLQIEYIRQASLMSTHRGQEDSDSDSQQASFHYRPDPQLGANKYLMADYQLSCTINYFNREPYYSQDSNQNDQQQAQQSDSHISYLHSSDAESRHQNREEDQDEEESSRSHYYNQESSHSSNSYSSDRYNSSQLRRPRLNQRRNYQYQYDDRSRMNLYGPEEDEQQQRGRNRSRRQDRRIVISQEREQKRGICQEILDEIPTLTWKKQYQIYNKDEKCTICLSTYEIGQTLRVLQCIHRFHQDCIDKWLKKNANCPSCRKTIEKKEQY